MRESQACGAYACKNGAPFGNASPFDSPVPRLRPQHECFLQWPLRVLEVLTAVIAGLSLAFKMQPATLVWLFLCSMADLTAGVLLVIVALVIVALMCICGNVVDMQVVLQRVVRQPQQQQQQQPQPRQNRLLDPLLQRFQRTRVETDEFNI